MDDGWVSVGAAWVGAATSVVLLELLEVDSVLEVLVEDAVEEAEEVVSLVAEEVSVPVAEAFKTRRFSICSRTSLPFLLYSPCRK